MAEHFVFVICNCLSVCATTLIIKLPLSHFFIMKVLFVPIHEIVVVVASFFDRVSEFRVLVCDPNLLLKTHLFIVQLAQTILKH